MGILDGIKKQLSQSKQILKDSYDMGAQRGKELKKQHKQKLQGTKNEEKSDD